MGATKTIMTTTTSRTTAPPPSQPAPPLHPPPPRTTTPTTTTTPPTTNSTSTPGQRKGRPQGHDDLATTKRQAFGCPWRALVILLGQCHVSARLQFVCMGLDFFFKKNVGAQFF